MFEQHVFIHNYDWNVTILYNVKCIDAKYISLIMRDMECSVQSIRQAIHLITGERPNQGFTFSNKRRHETLIVVGFASSLGEFASTLVHELDHLVDHISQVYDIPYESEENSYLIGDVAKLICDEAIKHFMKYII